MEHKESCVSCTYWNKVEKSDDGECRESCPTPILMPVQTVLGGKPILAVNAFFPHTRPDIWCGKYKSLTWDESE